jgi:hypothetical protein
MRPWLSVHGYTRTVSGCSWVGDVNREPAIRCIGDEEVRVVLVLVVGWRRQGTQCVRESLWSERAERERGRVTCCWSRATTLAWSVRAPVAAASSVSSRATVAAVSRSASCKRGSGECH